MDIFIGNISDDLLQRDLEALFKDYGNWVSSSIKERLTPEGIQRYGFIMVLPDEAGKQAIEQLHGRRIHGRPLMVREYIHRAQAVDPTYHPEEGTEVDRRYRLDNSLTMGKVPEWGTKVYRRYSPT